MSARTMLDNVLENFENARHAHNHVGTQTYVPPPDMGHVKSLSIDRTRHTYINCDRGQR